jgi:phosphoglycolate phosphatase
VTIQLAIFDLDGTLIDSLNDLAVSMNAVLESHGFPTHPLDPYRHFVGDGISNLVRRALPAEQRSDDLVAICVHGMRREYAARKLDTTRPYPGIREVLATLTSRGVKTAVLSNKPDDPTREITDELLAPHHFDLVRGALPEVPLKPDPTAALEIAARLQVAPKYTLLVGDTPIDMQTARAAGMIAVGVTWGFREADELRFGGAHHIIHEALDLTAFLGAGPS